jgi:Ribosomal protein L7/L12 C-terminal domain
MNPDESTRLELLERQVAFLFRHLGLNPNLTGSDPGRPPTFSSPAEAFGTAAVYGDRRPAAFAPPSFSSAPPSQGVPLPQAAPPPQAPTAPAAQPMPVAGLVPGPADCPPAVMDAIQRGKLIVAIKIYRELTGLGLKEAKAAVDGWARGR